MAELIASIYLENFKKLSTSEFTIQIVETALKLKLDSLSKQDLSDISNDIIKKVNLLLSQNESAYESGVISLKQRNDIRRSLDQLQEAQYELNAARVTTQLDNLLTDEPSSAKAKIQKATGNLQKAQMDLLGIDKFLTFIDKLTSLTNIIISAILAPSVASISSLLQQILNSLGQ